MADVSDRWLLHDPGNQRSDDLRCSNTQRTHKASQHSYILLEPLALENNSEEASTAVNVVGLLSPPTRYHDLEHRSGVSTSTLQPETDTNFFRKTPNSPSSPAKPKVKFFKDVGLWKWELTALAVSCGLLVTIFLALATHDGKEQSQCPHRITINSLVSVLTTIMAAELAMVLAESECTICELNLSSFRPLIMPTVISQIKWSWFSRPHHLIDVLHFDQASRGLFGSLLFVGRFCHHPTA